MGGEMARLSLYSLVFIVIAGIVLVATPQLREIYTRALETATGDIFSPDSAELEKIARQHPRDLFMQLAVAPYLPVRSGHPDLRPYQKTFPISPASPAPHLRLALALLSEISGVDMGKDDKLFRPTFTAVEQEYLAEAIEQLRTAASLSKDNAAPDLLLAYALFSSKQDQAAEAALRAALGKPGWSVYEPELRQAQLALYRESGASATIAAMDLLSAWPLNLNADLRSFTRFLMISAENFRRAGDERRALLYYCAMVHLGDVVLRGADSFIDALVASAILAIASDDFITPAERKQLDTSSLSKVEKRKRGNEARQRGLVAYLRANGQGRLADRYQKDITYLYLGPLMASMRKITEGELREINRLSNPLHEQVMILALLQLIMAAGLLAMTGVLCLFLRPGKEKRFLPAWRLREWLLLVAISLVPAYLLIVSVFLIHGEPGLNDYDFVSSNWWTPAISLLLLLLCTIIAALLKRRRLPPENRAAKSRSVVDAFRIMLPPTVALLLLVTLALTLPLAKAFNKFSTRTIDVAQQGEINYWRLGRPAP